MKKEILTSSFYQQNVVEVAKQLIGKRLVSRKDGLLTSGLIVESEAYLPSRDSASHSSRGRTPGNQSMFGKAGIGYVYPIHAKHCFNVVAQKVGEGCAVLIRAIEPLDGIQTMMERRGIESHLDLARGPARMCIALGIDQTDDGVLLDGKSKIWIDRIQSRDYSAAEIRATRRIGVTSNKRRLLRFVVRDSPFASGPKYLR